MKKFLLLISVFMVGFSTMALGLSDLTGKVSPQPRQMSEEVIRFVMAPEYTQMALFGEAQTNIVGSPIMGVFSATAQEAYRRYPADLKYPTKDAKYLQVIGGLLKDAEIQAELKNEIIPELPAQGFVIRKVYENDKGYRIVIGANDWKGLFYGFSTLRQMLSYEDGVLYMNYVDVVDYPTWEYRFASDDTDPGNINKYLDLARNKFSAFAWQYRTDWREFAVTDNQKRILKDIKKISDVDLLDFMFMLHIYATPRMEKFFSIADENDIALLIEKCQIAASSGFEIIMILADDLTPRVGESYIFHNEEESVMFNGSVGKAHGYLMARLHEALKKDFPELKLAMVGAPYSLNHGIGTAGVDQYVIDWGEAAPKDVYWVWTGPEVISSEIAKEDYNGFAELLSGQPMFVWDNSNCIYAPTPRWETTFYDEMVEDSDSIIYWNGRVFTTSWPWAVPYFDSANAYAWNPENYDAEREYNSALAKAFGADNVELLNNAREAMIACQVAVSSGEREGFKELLENFEAAYAELEKRVDNNGDPLPAQALAKELSIAREFQTIQVSAIELYELDGDIVIDGDINADEWAGATSFALARRDGAEDNNPVKAMIGYTKDGLYIAMDITNHAVLPDIPDQPHDSSVYLNNDCVELFIQPSVGGKYGHWCFDYEGNRFEEIEADGGFGWNGDWKLATKQHETGWTAELFIPVIELELLQPKQLIPGNMWKMNIFRVSSDFGIQAYSLGGNRFHEPQFFGELLIR